jgi:CheY-like chemotaxis protein
MSIQSLRVWLVDDDASIRWVLERALRNGGMTPRAFEAAEPALDALRRESPDVLITDIRMPGQSGLDLLKKIRDARPALPVIVMTAHSDLGNAVSAYEAARSSICRSRSTSTRPSTSCAGPRAYSRAVRANPRRYRKFPSCSAAHQRCSRCSARSVGLRARASPF